MKRQHWLTAPVAVIMGALVLVAFAASGGGLGGPGLTSGAVATLGGNNSFTGTIISSSGYGLASSAGTVFGIQTSGSNALANFPTGGSWQLRHSNSGTAWLTVSESGTRIGATGTYITSSVAGSSTIDFGTTTTTCNDSTGFTVTGAVVGSPCHVGAPSTGGSTNATYSCYVSATDTVKVRHCAAGTADDPASASFSVRVFNP